MLRPVARSVVAINGFSVVATGVRESVPFSVNNDVAQTVTQWTDGRLVSELKTYSLSIPRKSVFVSFGNHSSGCTLSPFIGLIRFEIYRQDPEGSMVWAARSVFVQATAVIRLQYVITALANRCLTHVRMSVRGVTLSHRCALAASDRRREAGKAPSKTLKKEQKTP